MLVTCPEPGVDQIVPIRFSRIDCGSRVCVTSGSRGLCALSPDPSPLCADAGASVCESDTSRVRCGAGFITARDECLHCFVPDGGNGSYVTCEGGPASLCSDDSDCVPSLTCSPDGFCVTPSGA